MREQLLGYLIDALEPDERDEVEDCLKSDPELQRELEVLHEGLEPLRAAEGHFEPPAGLARRTCQAVAQARLRRGNSPQARAVASRANEPLAAGNRWTFADLAVAAGIVLAAGLLLLPAIHQSRIVAQRTGCQNNLKELAAALVQYSERHDGYFPGIPQRGKQAVAGIFAVRLTEGRLLLDPQWLICPSSLQAHESEGFRVPTVQQIEEAHGAKLVDLWRSMGGSYGYTLGFMDEGDYQSVRNESRSTFPIMADAPNPNLEGCRSSNHSGCGQNVLYEDGHVTYLRGCTASGCHDHIFLNDDGVMAAGTHRNDAVIGHSASRPILQFISSGAPR